MSRPRLPFCLFLLLIFSLAPSLSGRQAAVAAETHTDFNLKEEKVESGNILNLIFGPAPPLATERAILVIDAYFDRNGNERRDPGEEALDREVFCLVDDIEYDVPAFIPGLSLGGNYKIICAGDRYEPLIRKKELFIDRRGQIIKVDLPCRPSPREERPEFLRSILKAADSGARETQRGGR